MFHRSLFGPIEASGRAELFFHCRFDGAVVVHATMKKKSQKPSTIKRFSSSFLIRRKLYKVENFCLCHCTPPTWQHSVHTAHAESKHKRRTTRERRAEKTVIRDKSDGAIVSRRRSKNLALAFDSCSQLNRAKQNVKEGRQTRTRNGNQQLSIKLQLVTIVTSADDFRRTFRSDGRRRQHFCQEQWKALSRLLSFE